MTFGALHQLNPLTFRTGEDAGARVVLCGEALSSAIAAGEADQTQAGTQARIVRLQTGQLVDLDDLGTTQLPESRGYRRLHRVMIEGVDVHWHQRRTSTPKPS